MKKLLLLASIIGALALAWTPRASGTPEFAKKAKKSCLTCHTALGKPDLNDAGKYYKTHKYSLVGYKKKPGGMVSSSSVGPTVPVQP